MFSKPVLTDGSGLFQMTLISHCLPSLLPKPTLILAKSSTSDPYKWGFLFRRKSVQHLITLTLAELRAFHALTRNNYTAECRPFVRNPSSYNNHKLISTSGCKF